MIWARVTAAGAAMLLSTHVLAADSSAVRARINAAEGMRFLATCYLESGRKQIEKVLVADPKTMAFERWDDRRGLTCTSRAAQKIQTWIMPYGDMLRYALAEELVRSDLERMSLREIAIIPPLGHARGELKFHSMVSRQAREKAKSYQTAGIYLSALGECVVRADPESSRRMLSADIASDAETGAFNALMPSVQRCIDRAKTVQLDKDSLRGAIALNYYRLAKAAAASRGVQ